MLSAKTVIAFYFRKRNKFICKARMFPQIAQTFGLFLYNSTNYRIFQPQFHYSRKSNGYKSVFGEVGGRISVNLIFYN